MSAQSEFAYPLYLPLVSLDPSYPSDLVLTPLSNELWASWKAGPGARDGYVLELSGPVENTTTLGPEECNAVFPGPLPPGHYTLGLKVRAGPYDARVEASAWLAGESGWRRSSGWKGSLQPEGPGCSLSWGLLLLQSLLHCLGRVLAPDCG